MDFLSELPNASRGLYGHAPIKAFVEELKQQPNNWALLRVMPEGKFFNGHVQYRRMYPGTDWATRKVDGLCHVYGMWVG